jgi:hypothetical protein
MMKQILMTLLDYECGRVLVTVKTVRRSDLQIRLMFQGARIACSKSRASLESSGTMSEALLSIVPKNLPVVVTVAHRCPPDEVLGLSQKRAEGNRHV